MQEVDSYLAQVAPIRPTAVRALGVFANHLAHAVRAHGATAALSTVWAAIIAAGVETLGIAFRPVLPMALHSLRWTAMWTGYNLVHFRVTIDVRHAHATLVVGVNVIASRPCLVGVFAQDACVLKVPMLDALRHRVNAVPKCVSPGFFSYQNF